MTYNDEETQECIATLQGELAQVKESLADIKESLIFVSGMMAKADEVISSVTKEVMPTIEALTNSPMLKMLGIGKR